MDGIVTGTGEDEELDSRLEVLLIMEQHLRRDQSGQLGREEDLGGYSEGLTLGLGLLKFRLELFFCCI